MSHLISPIQFFQALADETRLRCLVLLQQSGELCVCELTYALNLSQPKISRHLAHLKSAGMVQDKRKNVWIFYTLHPHLPAWMLQSLTDTAHHLHTTAPFYEDTQRLQQMPQRPSVQRCYTSLKSKIQEKNGFL